MQPQQHPITVAMAAAAESIEQFDRDLASIMAASIDANADDEHDPDGSTIAFERAQLQAMRSATLSRLSDLQRAWQLVQLGSYGTCDHCGVAIPAERLQALAGTTRCVRCADRRRGRS